MRQLTDEQYNQMQLKRIQDGQRIFELEQEIGNLRSQLENGEQMYIAMRDRCAKVEAKMDALPADWQQDSSLETWFPLTAEELENRKSENARLKAEVGEDEMQQFALHWLAMGPQDGSMVDRPVLSITQVNALIKARAEVK